MSIDYLARELKAIVDGYADEYQRIMDADEADMKQGLKPGEYFPPRLTRNGFYTEKRRDEAREAAGVATASARRLIDAEKARYADELSASPTADALRAIEALRLNPHPDEATVSSAMRRYGSNVLAASAIKAIAADAKVHVSVPEGSAADALGKLAEFETFTYRALSAEGMGDGYFSPGTKAVIYGTQLEDIVNGTDNCGSVR